MLRCLVPGLLAVVVAGADLAQGAGAEAARRILGDLANGRTAALIEADPELFADPPGLPDPQDPEVLRPWTGFLPAAIARLPVGDQAQVVAVLDQRWLVVGRNPRAFLPATGAATALTVARDLAWDRGRLEAFLALAESSGSATDLRVGLARSLLDPGLGAPGGMRLVVGAEPSSPARGSIRWRQVTGWLVAAQADDGLPRWQRPVGPGALVVTGRDGALVRNADGLWRIGADGTAVRLPALPGRIRPLAIDGGTCWFGDGSVAWRVDGQVAVLDLPEPIQGPPLVSGDRSLWLGRQRLWLVEGVRPIASWWHRLEGDALLTWTAQGPGLRHQGRLWAVTGMDDRDLDSLIASGCGEAAVALAPDLAKAWLALPERIAQAPATAAGTVQERAVFALLRGEAASVAAFAATEPGLILPGSRPMDADWPFPSAWAHQRSGLGWAMGPAAVAGGLPRSGPGSEPPVDGPGRLRLERRDGDYRLACADGESWWWRQRWSGPDEHRAPATAVWTWGGVAWVAAGDDRLWAFDRATGSALGEAELAAGDRGEEAAWTPVGIALPGSDALGPRIRFVSASTSRVVRLDQPVRWLIPGGTGAVVADRSGGLWLVEPGGVRRLPDPDLLADGRRPAIAGGGLQREGKCWVW